jgi:UDP-N-acetylmuramate dehydrogenase
MMVERTGLEGDVRDALARIPGVTTAFDESTARHVSFGVGGPADAFSTVGEPEVARRLLDLLGERGVPWMPLGRGTNVVFADAGFRGVVVRLAGGFERVDTNGVFLNTGAAAGLSSLIERGIAAGLGGLEFLAGIPGCVGGSLPGNAGSGIEWIGGRMEEAEVLIPGGAVRRLRADELGFAYRSSRLPAIGGIIFSARFRMEPREPGQIREMLKGYLKRRKGQPHDAPNAGCIFKNPPGASAGRLIDAAGLKGFKVGGVTVSAEHANFMLNSGGATASDLTAAIIRVRKRVYAEAGIMLEPEVRLLDERGRPVGLE